MPSIESMMAVAVVIAQVGVLNTLRFPVFFAPVVIIHARDLNPRAGRGMKELLVAQVNAYVSFGKPGFEKYQVTCY